MRHSRWINRHATPANQPVTARPPAMRRSADPAFDGGPASAGPEGIEAAARTTKTEGD